MTAPLHNLPVAAVARAAAVVLVALVILLYPASTEEANASALADILNGVRAKHDVPGLAAAVLLDGKIVAEEAVGVRKQGGREQVTPRDRFHIGSITKPMTATLAAILIEKGMLRWDTTIGASFPDLEVHEQYRKVTLEQLLSHRGGAPQAPPRPAWDEAWKREGTPSEQRTRFVRSILAREPEAEPGTKYIYSNQGYAIAGMMLEKAAGKPWEDLIRQRLFRPLGMASAGFGTPASEGKVDQPWGHASGEKGFEPVPPGPEADNPPAIAPAGTVHCTMADLVRFADLHLRSVDLADSLLKQESLARLHRPVGEEQYALGWIVVPRPWADGLALVHNGSNTMFYSVVWLAPKKSFAVAVATNCAGAVAENCCDNVAAAVIGRYLEHPPSAATDR